MKSLIVSLAFLTFSLCCIADAAEPRAGSYPGRHLSSNPDEKLHIIVYKLADLPLRDNDDNFNPAVLVRLIEATVSAPEWKRNGGSSTVASYAPAQMLVVSTTAKNHLEIRKLIDSIRENSVKVDSITTESE